MSRRRTDEEVRQERRDRREERRRRQGSGPPKAKVRQHGRRGLPAVKPTEREQQLGRAWHNRVPRMGPVTHERD
jgi:hypothetical protein